MERCNGLTLDDPRFAELDLAIDRYRDRSDGVVYVLERAKYLFGALPPQVLDRVAEALDMPSGDVCQAVSFYDFFATRPVGTHMVSVCLGTHCYLAGASALFDRLQAELGIGPGETTPDGLFSLTVYYSGDQCGDERAFIIDGERFAVRPEEIPAVLSSFQESPTLVGAGAEDTD